MIDSNHADFALDPRLEADTAFVADWELSRVLLMDDSRFPWLILVPRRPDATELDGLAADDQVQLLREIARGSSLLRSIAPCDKMNIGALGNIVRQLHVHVVARRTDDAATAPDSLPRPEENLDAEGSPTTMDGGNPAHPVHDEDIEDAGPEDFEEEIDEAAAEGDVVDAIRRGS